MNLPETTNEKSKNPILLVSLSILTGLLFLSPYFNLSCTSTGVAGDSPQNNYDCENPPKGMVCIPGSPAIIGASENDPDALPGEKPQKVVYVKTFYMDKYEITNEEYDKCVKAGACKKFNTSSPMFRDTAGPKQPAVPLSWDKAFNYCKWRGKRLPTEAEWEKTARGGRKGTIYPWGNEKPDCKKANYRPCYKATSNVGSFPPGHYGVYDMAGNGYEWVNDWATNCRENCSNSCGKACSGVNPLGPCSGKYPCGKRNKKIMKGGSWWWPETQMRGSWRRTQKIKSGGHRLSARCASDTPYLTNAKAWMIKSPPPTLPDPTPPDEDDLEILHSIETDTLNKTICAKKWTSPDYCKDPVSYIVTNEQYIYYFAPYLKNIGGGYAGIAADANYTFIAHARSRWVWLFDFDRNIVALHKILKALIIKSETPKIFVSRFNWKRTISTMEIIRNAYGKDKDFYLIKYVFYKYKKMLYPSYLHALKQNKKFGKFGWLRSKDAYRYIRLLYTQNRISISPGDMLKNKTIQSIAKSAKKLGVNIRVYYPSNAEEFWRFNKNYKNNITSLPFDEASIVIRTVHEYPWHKRIRGNRFWHYNIHGAMNYQKYLRLKDYYMIDHFRYERVYPVRGRDTFSTIHLPSSLPETTIEKIYKK